MIADDTRPPTGPTTPLRRCELAWLAAVLVASSILVVYTSRSIGPTFDEPFYLAKGLDYWRTGSPKSLMRAGTMPLPVDVQTLPLHLWERHRGEPFNTVEQLDELLPVARAMNLPFWWLLLASGFRLARRLGGPTAAGVAVGLLGFEPNLLAHAALATTDIAVTAAILAATNSFLRGRGTGWWRRAFVPGVWVGIAVLCKASAATFLPLAFAVILWRRGELRRAVRDGVTMGVIAAATAFAYVGTDWAVEPSFVKWADTLPDGVIGDATRAVANNLRVFPNAAEGIIQQVKHNVRGHGVFALGEYRHRAVWYYFPVVLSQKLPEPVLVLMGWCAMAFLGGRGSRRAAAERERQLRPTSPRWGEVAERGAATPAGEGLQREEKDPSPEPFAPQTGSPSPQRGEVGRGWAIPRLPLPSLPACIALAFLLFSLTCRVQIGVRLVFPLVAFLVLAVSGAVSSSSRRRWFGWLAVAASAVVAIFAAPHGLRYQNQLWGGASRAGDNLTDSNCDWGQGVPELREWWRTAGEPPLTVWYYGTDPNAFRPPFHAVPLHVLPDRSPEFVTRTSAGGYFAVGRTFLTACPDRRPDMLALIDWLKGQQPVAEVGCFVVYLLK